MITLSKRIGVDLGTVNSLVWVQGKGVVLNEPTVVAVTLRDRRVVAVGEMAKNMLGRTPGNILTSKPLRHGVIADYAITEAMLRFFLHKVMGRGTLIKPEVMISVPAGSTQVERRAVLEAALSAGARHAYLIDEPLVAIIGAGISIAEASGNMVLNIGGGAAEAAVVSLGGVVASKSVRVGGSSLDEAIQKYVRKAYSVIIGDSTAEDIKIKIGSAIPVKKQLQIEVKGRDVVQGMPHELTLNSSDVHEALQPLLQQILGMVKRVLEEVPPELASDIIDKGMVLTGGTALLNGLDRWLSQELGIPVSVAERPLTCAIEGIGIVLDDLETYGHVLRGSK